MSRHRTLKVSGTGIVSRNVLTREERLGILNREGRWNEGNSVVGLPKTKVPNKVKKKK